MTRIITAVFILVITACAQLDTEEVDRDDDYSTAAMSWLGANMQEMLAAWPEPNMRCSNNKVGRAGCAWWRHRSGGGRDGHVGYDYNCETVVHYDANLVITDIDVKFSRYCYRLFGDQFEQMTRHGVSTKSAAIDN